MGIGKAIAKRFLALALVSAMLASSVFAATAASNTGDAEKVCGLTPEQACAAIGNSTNCPLTNPTDSTTCASIAKDAETAAIAPSDPGDPAANSIILALPPLESSYDKPYDDCMTQGACAALPASSVKGAGEISNALIGEPVAPRSDANDPVALQTAMLYTSTANGNGEGADGQGASSEQDIDPGSLITTFDESAGDTDQNADGQTLVTSFDETETGANGANPDTTSGASGNTSDSGDPSLISATTNRVTLRLAQDGSNSADILYDVPIDATRSVTLAEGVEVASNAAFAEPVLTIQLAEVLHFVDEVGKVLSNPTTDASGAINYGLKDIVVDRSMIISAVVSADSDGDGMGDAVDWAPNDNTLQQYIRYSADANGSLTGTALYNQALVGDMLSGSAPAPVPVPNSGYAFDKWVNAAGTAVDPDTAAVLKENAELKAIFVALDGGSDENPSDPAPTLYSIRYVAGPNGALSGTAVYENLSAGSKVSDVAPAPSPQPESGYRFAAWEIDGATADLSSLLLGESNLVITAAFEADITQTPDPIPDPAPTGNHSVKYELGANGKTFRDPITQLEVPSATYQNLAAGAKLAELAPAPIAVPNYGYTLAFWTDQNGKRIDPATAVVGDNTTKITANFVSLKEIGDLNADGIRDKYQNVYRIDFVPTTGGKLRGSCRFVFIGGKKGDGIALTLDNLVSETPFQAPTPMPQANYEFSGWLPSVSLTEIKLSGNVVVRAVFKKQSCRIQFTCQDLLVGLCNTAYGETIKSGCIGLNVPKKDKYGRSFCGWLAPNGSVYSTKEALSLSANGSMTFQAVFGNSSGKR